MPKLLEPGAERKQLSRLSHRHEGILVWLIENPDRPLGECAKELGYTPAWISTVIYTDMFQEEYQRLCKEKRVIATHTIANRLGRIGAKALDLIEKRLEAGAVSEKFLQSVAADTLDRLGFTSQKETTENHLHLHVDPQMLERARERQRARFAKVESIAS